MTQINNKLAELKQRLADREQEYVTEQAQRKEALEIEMLEALLNAQDAHGVENVRAVVAPNSIGFVIVKKPHNATYRKFADLKEAKLEDFDNLVKPCVVGGAAAYEKYEKLCQEAPAFVVEVANACAELAGVNKSKHVGK